MKTDRNCDAFEKAAAGERHSNGLEKEGLRPFSCWIYRMFKGRSGRALRTIDKDRSGTVSLNELRISFIEQLRRFESIDRDGSGTIEERAQTALNCSMSSGEA